jgi:uncharacterized protein (DUF1499 family)
MAEGSRGGVLSKLGGILVVCLVVGPLLARLRVIPAIAGFGLFAVGGLGSVLVAIASIVQAARGRGFTRGGVLAVVAAVVFMVLASRDAGVPAINDFTTDLDDPPAFTHAATIPANQNRDLRYPSDFAQVQRQCCADLHPARLPVPRDLAFARARDAAVKMPRWTITETDPANGMIEAIATSRLFGFQDDIVVRVREVSPQISRVDMRSKSRDGKGDLGVNAARIRTYVETLEKGPGS